MLILWLFKLYIELGVWNGVNVLCDFKVVVKICLGNEMLWLFV